MVDIISSYELSEILDGVFKALGDGTNTIEGFSKKVYSFDEDNYEGFENFIRNKTPMYIEHELKEADGEINSGEYRLRVERGWERVSVFFSVIGWCFDNKSVSYGGK